ncbi:HAD domain-containing protein [Kitasatospora sp. NPDC093806]|uniref:HAD domain-containing protein n=1 Tax=Kitasatospora sp. NPDC093806 TaxID=3155075 RepID=UPI0034132AC8
MHQPPYLLLDVDGVLIPFPADDQSIPPTHTAHQVQLTGYPDPIQVWLNHDHGALLADALHSGLVRPAWCTSWRADAPRVIAPLLGLSDFEHIELPRLPITTSHPAGYLWKRDHVADWLGDAPAIWIDDDFTGLDHLWAAKRSDSGCPTLLIQPDPYVGLQDPHITAALEWASTLARR